MNPPTTPTPDATVSPIVARSRRQKNANAIRHGMRGSALPPGCGGIRRATDLFRQQLEQSVLDARGEIGMADAMSISTAYRWERHAQLAQRWLRVNFDDLSHADRLSYSREAARASAERDKAIAALKLDRPQVDMFNGTLPELPPVDSPIAGGNADSGPLVELVEQSPANASDATAAVVVDFGSRPNVNT